MTLEEFRDRVRALALESTIDRETRAFEEGAGLFPKRLEVDSLSDQQIIVIGGFGLVLAS